MALVIFNRKDEKVKKDAEDLTLEDFQKKYKGVTTEVVLKSVWKDYNKQAHVKKAIEKNTDESVDLPEPEKVEEEEERPARITKKKEKPQQQAGDKTRATRLRELIAEGKDKAGAKEILLDEGYEVGSSYHSEWNRLSK